VHTATNEAEPESWCEGT